MVLVWLEVCACSPYGGWGPGQGFGHTGRTFPPPNPNAIYGYDKLGLFGDDTSYGARYNPFKKR